MLARRLASVSLTVLALCGRALPASADTFLVTNTNDSGPGSLRSGIEQANARPGFDVVGPDSVLGPIFLLTPLPALQDDLHVTGWPRPVPPDPPIHRPLTIDGSQMTGSAVGFRIVGDRSAVAGVAIQNFRDAQGGGIGVLVEGDDGYVVSNFIGTDRTGTIAKPNDTGLVVRGRNYIIGDDDAGWISLVSGNTVGISIEAPAAGTVIRNTWIGLDRSGAALPNASDGVRIIDGSGTRLGVASLPDNRIAFNGGSGLVVDGAQAAGNDVLETLIFGNGGIPIDLGGDGVTPNDPGDGDAGPNGLQNFPVLTSAAWNGNYAEIQGTLESRPLATYRLSFHAGPSLEPSGHARGERLVGTLSVTTDAAGVGSFTFFTAGVDAVNRFVGATATDIAGNLSEASAGIEVLGMPPAQRTFVVNTADGANDGACLPNHCSLVEARDAAEQSPNGTAPDRIHFAIPGPGPHTITGNFMFYDAVIIDGYTQPGASPNTVPFGAGGLDTALKIEIVCPNIAANDTGIGLTADSLVRGLAVRKCGGSQVWVGDRNAVEGCFLGTDAAGAIAPANNGVGARAGGNANRLGGTSPAQRNLMSGGRQGVKISGSDNAVEGNLIGTTPDGLSSLTNFLEGVGIETGLTASTGNVIGGTGAAGNVISGNAWTAGANTFGVLLATYGVNAGVSGNTVRGNWIGLNARGDAALPNKTGIGVVGASTSGNVIEGNVISGNSSGTYGSGIYLFNDSQATAVRGNWIGTGPGGVGSFGNTDAGVAVFNDSRGNSIQQNTIRGNGGPGVVIVGTEGNPISRNAIEANGRLGIDLGSDGVTPNDPGDGDTGANGLQNFPVVFAAGTDGSVIATFSGAPSTLVTVEFFASASADPSGHGEGGRYLGAATLVTNGSGAGTVATVLPAAAQLDEWVTATATGAAGGNTSEFGPGARAANTAFTPMAVAVDAGGNGVFEPGETVTVAPAWHNASGSAALLTGLASAFTGPPGGTYVIADGAAAYGTVPDGGTASCTVTGDCYALQAGVTARPAPHVDAAFREHLSPGSVKTWVLHLGNSYSDVPASSPFYRFVETVLHRDVMGPCAATSFCPFFPVPREHMAPFVLTARDPAFLPPACTPGSEMFADVPASSPYCRWIEELARRGVVTGCGNGNYCPTLAVSREQMAVYLLATREGTGYAPPPCGAPRFNDVPASSPFCRWIEELARRGIVAGCGNGAYCPTLVVARDQMSVFLTGTFALQLYGP